MPEDWTQSLDPWISQPSGWYRFRFSVDASALESVDGLAICCGLVGDAFELYVNGEQIGSYGNLYPDFDAVPKDPLVFELPSQLIHRDDTNLVALRVNRYVSSGGVMQGPMLIGKSSEVREVVAAETRVNWLFEGMLLATFTAPALFCFGLILSGNRQPEITFLSIGTLILLLGSALDSRLFIHYFGFHWLRFLASSYCVILLPVVTHLLVARILKRQVGTLAVAGLAAATGVLLLGLIHIDNYFVVGWAWLAMQWSLQLVWCRWILVAILHKEEDAILVGIGLVMIIVTLSIEVLGIGRLGAIGGQPISLVGIAGFYVVGILVMSRRFERARVKMAKASLAVLNAHEEERKRISRELHDGVCQTLAAVHLQLRLANQPTANSAPSLESLTEQVRMCADDVRRVSRGLRPEYLERLSFAEAVQTLAEGLPGKISVECTTKILENGDARSSIKDALYRIVQEACSNAMTHGRAEAIEVVLGESKGALKLEITDNGKGIDAMSSENQMGIGTITIVERAQLLGGYAKIHALDGGGTRVAVSIPLKQS